MEKNKEQTTLKVDFLKKMLGNHICTALEDDDITEIMANPDGSVWFESRNKGMYKGSTIDEFEAQNFLLQLARLNDLYGVVWKNRQNWPVYVHIITGTLEKR